MRCRNVKNWVLENVAFWIDFKMLSFGVFKNAISPKSWGQTYNDLRFEQKKSVCSVTMGGQAVKDAFEKKKKKKKASQQHHRLLSIIIIRLNGKMQTHHHSITKSIAQKDSSGCVQANWWGTKPHKTLTKWKSDEGIFLE